MTVSQVDFDKLKKEFDDLKKLVGWNYLNTPQPTDDNAQNKAHFFSTWAEPVNELPSGKYPLGISVQEINYILEDARADITALQKKPSGTQVDTQAIIDAVTANVLAALARGATSQNPGALTVQDEVGGGHFADLSFGRLLLKANTQRNTVQGGINDEFIAEYDVNGWDSGAKRKRNFNCVGTRKRPSSADGPNGYGSFEHSTWPAVESEDPMADRAGWNTPGWYQPYGPIFDRNGVKVERFYRGHGYVILEGEQQINDANNNKIAQRRQTATGPQRQGWSHLNFVCPERPGQSDDNGSGGTPENLAVSGEDGTPGVRDRSLVFVENQLHRIKMRGDGSLWAEPIPAGYFNP